MMLWSHDLRTSHVRGCSAIALFHHIATYNRSVFEYFML